jgi:hopanoid biosynthesis associated protein HpnK
MVGAPAAADAVARAKTLPGLAVGLHLVLTDGAPILPASEVPALVGADGSFDPNMARAGFRFFFSPRARRQLAAEIGAQFEVFRATGLRLDHVNGHKHFHVHPTVARLVVEIGRKYGLRAIRLPFEPAAALRAAFPGERFSAPGWSPVVTALRRRIDRAGLVRNDQVFGIAWSGNMVEERVLALLAHLPEGLSELYFHPTIARGGTADDLGALMSRRVRARIAELGIELTSYAAVGRAARAG